VANKKLYFYKILLGARVFFTLRLLSFKHNEIQGWRKYPSFSQELGLRIFKRNVHACFWNFRAAFHKKDA